jgi:hypothetical protein
MVGDTHVAATVAFGYRVPCFLGGSQDLPNLLACGSVGTKQFDVRDAFFGDIDGFLSPLLFGVGRRTSLLGIYCVELPVAPVRPLILEPLLILRLVGKSGVSGAR